MKLSEMTADQTLDTLAALTPYLADLFDNSEIVDIFDVGAAPLKENATEKEKQAYEKELNKTGIKRFSKLIDYLVKTQREMIMGIFAALNLQTVEEFRKGAGFIVMAKTIMDIKNDKELIDFFMSFAQSEQVTQSDTLQK